MNKVIMMGRLTKDPEIRYATGEIPKAVVKLSIAVDRQFKAKDGKVETDFFNCVAFKQTAEFIDKYFRKGMKALVEGRLQNDHFKDRDGKTQYQEQIVVEQIEFAEKKEGGPATEKQVQETFQGIMNMDDEGIPFSF